VLYSLSWLYIYSYSKQVFGKLC